MVLKSFPNSQNQGTIMVPNSTGSLLSTGNPMAPWHFSGPNHANLKAWGSSQVDSETLNIIIGFSTNGPSKSPNYSFLQTAS